MNDGLRTADIPWWQDGAERWRGLRFPDAIASAQKPQPPRWATDAAKMPLTSDGNLRDSSPRPSAQDAAVLSFIQNQSTHAALDKRSNP